MDSQRFYLALVAALIVTFRIAVSAGADSPITQDELVRRTQELFDAVVPGNAAPWKTYFADDCMYSDVKDGTWTRLR